MATRKYLKETIIDSLSRITDGAKAVFGDADGDQISLRMYTAETPSSLLVEDETNGIVQAKIPMDTKLSSTLESGGVNEIQVDGLSGDLSDRQDPKNHANRHTEGGPDALSVEDLPTSGAADTVPKSDGSGGVVMEAIAGIPSGTVTMWSGSVSEIPGGWVLCDGNNGTPDLRDRFIVGADGAYTVGQTGGTSTRSISQAQMPSHSHGGSTSTDGSHSHQVYYDDGASGNTRTIQNLVRDDSNSSGLGAPIQNNGAHSHSLSINSTGSGNAVENRPPYHALAYMMKV